MKLTNPNIKINENYPHGYYVYVPPTDGKCYLGQCNKLVDMGPKYFKTRKEAEYGLFQYFTGSK